MIRDRLNTYAKLGRIWISFATGFSAATGHILAVYFPRPGILMTGAGVFLLACGASALNQYQERDTDALMERTRSRPLPSGSISFRHALLFALVCSLGGLIAIFVSGGFAGLIGGLFAVIWYNGLYTYLKKKNAYAFLPGALVGAITPALGWVAGSGSYTDSFFVLCLFFYLWQVPHFWLYAAQYGKEYSDAGLPSIASIFSAEQLARIIFIWISAIAVTSLFFFPAGLALQLPVRYMMVAASLWLIIQGSRLLIIKSGSPVYGKVLGFINLYPLIVMSLLIADRIILWL